jgi:hypothetical protein
VAEKTPWEDLVRRAYDANMRYLETVGRAATDYVQTVSRLWNEMPISWTPGMRSASPTAGDPYPSSAPAPATATIVLEGTAGSKAMAVVMLSNDLGREVEAAVVASPLIGPAGESIGSLLRTEPEVVRLTPGSRLPVTLIVDMDEKLAPGIDYRAEVNVPGLSPRGVPVIVRRRT